MKTSRHEINIYPSMATNLSPWTMHKPSVFIEIDCLYAEDLVLQNDSVCLQQILLVNMDIWYYRNIILYYLIHKPSVIWKYFFNLRTMYCPGWSEQRHNQDLLSRVRILISGVLSIGCWDFQLFILLFHFPLELIFSLDFQILQLGHLKLIGCPH